MFVICFSLSMLTTISPCGVGIVALRQMRLQMFGLNENVLKPGVIGRMPHISVNR